MCENGFYGPSWSNHPSCQSLAGFIAVDAWPDRVGPAVLPVLFMLIWAPPMIVFLSKKYCGCVSDQEADEEENKAIAAMYKRQLEQLENRTPKPENAVMMSELCQIQQQLKEEMDQLRSRRRQQEDREEPYVKFLRIYSFHLYVSFWLGMIYLVAEFGQYPFLFGAYNIFINIFCPVELS